MLDLPKWFWNAFAITVFIVINIILWFHHRHCKAKGIKPKPAFEKMQKHEKRITKWTDIFIIILILMMTIGYISFLRTSDEDTMVPPTPETVEIQRSVNFLLLFQYSGWVVLMASLLSIFQKNISMIKRIILLTISCTPLVFGTLYCIADKDRSNSLHLKLMVGTALCLAFINGPAIFLGKPFSEFLPKLLRKIPLPWFRMSVENETDKE